MTDRDYDNLYQQLKGLKELVLTLSSKLDTLTVFAAANDVKIKRLNAQVLEYKRIIEALNLEVSMQRGQISRTRTDKTEWRH